MIELLNIMQNQFKVDSTPKSYRITCKECGFLFYSNTINAKFCGQCKEDMIKKNSM